MADFARIDAAIEACAAHLAATKTGGTEIEAYLTRYLATLTYAVFEDECRAIIEDRARRIADSHGAFYVRASRDNVFRGLKIGELGRYLAKFSPDCQSEFQMAVHNTASHVAYDNILNGRHVTAHDTGTNMTFGEFRDAFENAKPVIAAFEASINQGVTAKNA